MLLYIIRHGDPNYTPDSLTERGKLQAAALAKRLARYGVDRIYSSPLKRAQQTAEPTCILTGKSMEILDWTSENRAWEDFSVEANGQNGPYRTWCFYVPGAAQELRSEAVTRLGANWFDADFFKRWHVPAEKGYRRIKEASDTFLAQLGYRHDGNRYRIEQPNEERVAVFCHQGFGLSWLGVLLDLPLPVTWTMFDISHSDMTVIRFRNHEDGYTVPQVLTLSNDSHLYAEGLPTRYQNELYF